MFWLEPRCSPPPSISRHMERAVVYWKINDTCYAIAQDQDSDIRFDDMVIYECKPGFRHLNPDVKHYCTLRFDWSHQGQSVCISKNKSFIPI